MASQRRMLIKRGDNYRFQERGRSLGGALSRPTAGQRAAQGGFDASLARTWRPISICWHWPAFVEALFARPSRCKYYGIEESGNKATDRMSARFLERQGIEADLIAERGRPSDLIVLARPHSTDLPWPNISVQSALRESARPVLLMPNTVSQVGKRNIIAWNGSLEAVRAVTFAIPILARGENTLVVTVGRHDVQPPGEKVVEHLYCHGIEAESKVVPLEESESSTLLSASRTFGADLIILGAYTRYRTGRPVFGSMSIEMIKQNKISIFIAH